MPLLLIAFHDAGPVGVLPESIWRSILLGSHFVNYQALTCLPPLRVEVAIASLKDRIPADFVTLHPGYGVVEICAASAGIACDGNRGLWGNQKLNSAPGDHR